MIDQGNIARSNPVISEEAFIRVYENFCLFDLYVLMPGIGLSALRALRLMEHGQTPDLIERAALATANTLVPLGPSVLTQFPILPVKIFETRYIEAAAGLEGVKPEKVLVTGAGDRLSELFALMDLPFDPQLAGERALLLTDPRNMAPKPGPKVIPVLGGFPKKVHIAEPELEYSSLQMQEKFGMFLPQCDVASIGTLAYDSEPQILLTDDTHQTLSRNYSSRTFDLLSLQRFEPNSLLPAGRSFSIDPRDPHLPGDCYQACKTLAGLIRLIRPGGHAIISIGTGNNMEATATRSILLSGLNQLLRTFKINTTQILNPMARLLLPQGTHTDEEQELLGQINTVAAISTLVIPFSHRLTDVHDELRNPGTMGQGTLRFLRAMKAGADETTANARQGRWDY